MNNFNIALSYFIMARLFFFLFFCITKINSYICNVLHLNRATMARQYFAAGIFYAYIAHILTYLGSDPRVEC